jgi:5'-deoxynucleotidase YfbR-like HD superfamily hydrolase
MKKGYKDIFEQMGLTPEECYLKQKNEIEMLKTQSTANYRHHEDSKEQIMEFLDEILRITSSPSSKEYVTDIKNNIEDIFDENLNSQNYYE